MDKVYIIGKDAVPGRLALGDGETLRMTLVALPGTRASVSLEVDIEGSGCELDLAGVYVCGSDDRLDMKISVRHLAGGSVSRQLFKGLVGGGARAVFDGLILVERDAQKTKAYQANHTVLLTDEARVESQPQLEIYADDVECSHGSTSGFLNLEEQFYMRSRGIPEDEALHLQKIAFLAPVIERLPEDMARQVYESIS